MKIGNVVRVGLVCAAVVFSGCPMLGSGTGPRGSAAKAVAAVAGQPGTSGSTDATGTSATFSLPAGIVFVSPYLYVTDSANSTIRRIDPATGAVITFAGQAGVAGYNDATGTSAIFDHPEGITSDGTRLYVADSGSNTIRQILISSAAVSLLAGSPGVAGTANGTGSNANFNNPLGICYDSVNGDLYVVDSGNFTIRQVTTAGAVTTLAGNPSAPGLANGVGAAASFLYSYGITFINISGTTPTLFVADAGNHAIRSIVISSKVVSTLAGQGVPGNADGTGTAAAFNWPEGITTDGTNLYVADTVNCTIRQVVAASGVVTTLAGQAGISGAANGNGDVATFNDPMGLTWDVGNTTIYLSDMFNCTIRSVK